MLKEYKSKIDKSKILEKLKVSKNNYFLFSLHREENVDNDKKFKILISSILKIQNFMVVKLLYLTIHALVKKIEKF